MTTPQPSNQLPEEVKPPHNISEREPVFPCWLYCTIIRPYSGEPYGWEQHFVHPGLCLTDKFSHWHPDQPTAPTVTPYLAPRPPAPVDAEWAKRAQEEYTNLWNEVSDHNQAVEKRGYGTLRVYPVMAEVFAHHAPADSASAQLAAITADRDEWKADSERLKAREVTLTDRQCLVQLAFTESGFNYESGEGLPELAKRVAGMASAYRARDNIGMSKEEYHKAKNALSQLAAMREENAKQAAILSPTDACDLATAVKRAVSRESELRTQLAAAQSEAGRLTAWKAYAESHGLHIALNKTGDCPEGRLAHTYREGTTLHRMFDEWSASIGWQDHLATLRRERDELLKDKERLLSWTTAIRDGLSGINTPDAQRLAAQLTEYINAQKP